MWCNMCMLKNHKRHVVCRTKVCTAALDAELVSKYEKPSLNINADYKKNNLNVKNNILAVGRGYCDPSLIV